jgi:hypothetical protein
VCLRGRCLYVLCRPLWKINPKYFRVLMLERNWLQRKLYSICLLLCARSTTGGKCGFSAILRTRRAPIRLQMPAWGGSPAPFSSAQGARSDIQVLSFTKEKAGQARDNRSVGRTGFEEKMSASGWQTAPPQIIPIEVVTVTKSACMQQVLEGFPGFFHLDLPFSPVFSEGQRQRRPLPLPIAHSSLEASPYPVRSTVS